MVVEDSRNGLLAAKAANITCIVTTNGYTEREDTSEGDLVVSELGDGENVQVDINTLKNLVK